MTYGFLSGCDSCVKNDVTWSYFTTRNLKILKELKSWQWVGLKLIQLQLKKNTQFVYFYLWNFHVVISFSHEVMRVKDAGNFFVCNLAKYFLTIKVLFCVAALHILKLLYQLADSGRVKWEAQIDFSGNNLWSFHASPAVAQRPTFWEPLVLWENKMSACL